MKGLTKRQREIIDYIQEFINNNRYSPSYREIGHHFGFSSLGSVYKHINTLKKKGMLLSESKSSRSLAPSVAEPPSRIQDCYDIPFIGNISAGVPIQTFTQTHQIAIPRHFIHSPEKTYALQVKGNSLNEELIADGDVLLVEARQTAHAGETVVALINGHDTIIKKYYPEGSNIRLIGCHIHQDAILLRPEDITIQGILIGLWRSVQPIFTPPKTTAVLGTRLHKLTIT